MIVTLIDVISHLQNLAAKYLFDQVSVHCGQVYWQEFLNQWTHYILWLNYSQNIALKERRQVKLIHFSGKQQTLHITVLHSPKNENHTLIYQLWDYTNHDRILTFGIIEDITAKDLELIQDEFLIFCSDNYQDQYK